MRAALVLVLLATGCMSPVRRVATHQVAYDFYRARYMETCPAPRKPAPWCKGFDGLVNRYQLDLQEGTEALVWVRKSKAKAPLQLKVLDVDRKKLTKGYKP